MDLLEYVAVGIVILLALGAVAFWFVALGMQIFAVIVAGWPAILGLVIGGLFWHWGHDDVGVGIFLLSVGANVWWLIRVMAD